MYKNIACIGSGTIGRSWAIIFALKDCNVNLYDKDNDVLLKAEDYIRKWIKFLIEKKAIKKSQSEIMNKINLTTDLRDAVNNSDYIQESVPENIEVKKQIFYEISSLTKSSSIIASSTSGLSMTEIQEATLKPDMCITVHPINPPHLIPLVEIVPGKKTREDTVKSTYNFMLELEKKPIILKKETPGFVFNRLATALWREALNLLVNDVATVEDIDKVIYSGMGPRCTVMGPFLTYHLGGGEGGLEYFIKHLNETFSNCWKSMATWTSIPRSAIKKAIDEVNKLDIVKNNTYSELVRMRDEKLLELPDLSLSSKENNR